MAPVVELLDGFYAAAMGCSPESLRAGGVTLVASDLHPVWFAKGSPLALYALDTGDGAVVSTLSQLVSTVADALDGAAALDHSTWMAIQTSISSTVRFDYWFEGVRLCCEPSSFLDRTTKGTSDNGTREIFPEEDRSTLLLRDRWGGKVFGHLVDGAVVCRAAVKAMSDVVWDLHVETSSGYRGRGYAPSAVSAACKYIFENDRLAGWGCDRSNTASLRVAQTVGFQSYGYDFGCVESVSRGACGRRRTARR